MINSKVTYFYFILYHGYNVPLINNIMTIGNKFNNNISKNITIKCQCAKQKKKNNFYNNKYNATAVTII